VHFQVVKTDFEMGLFDYFENRTHATEVQRILVPWLLALYGLSFKAAPLNVVHDMIKAIIDANGWFGPGVTAAEEAERFPLAFTNFAKKAKCAAGILLALLLEIIPCFSYDARPADKNLQPHRTTIRRALGALLENPVDLDDSVGREVLRSVMGQGYQHFDRKVIDFTTNEHLAALVKPGVKPVIWESDVKPSRRTVLNPIDNPGQQLLVDWIGTYFVLLFSVWYILFLHVVTHGREFVPPRRETRHCSANYSRRAGIRALQHPMVLPFLPTVGRGEGRQGNCSIYYYPVEELDHLRPLG
jgi:hypothetical protein